MKNTDETGKDLNSLPMISGKYRADHRFSDLATVNLPLHQLREESYS
jgi:hypothetical protein